jgi:DNA-binding MarR family transcriptional regulator
MAKHTDRLVLEHFLPYRLNRIAAATSQALMRIYRDAYGLTLPEWRTLATLGQFGGLTAVAIGRHSAMHKTKVSRAVYALEKRRWLARRRDEADRRVEHLTLTAAGREAYRALAPRMLKGERDLFSRLGKEDEAHLLQGLEALERALEVGTAGTARP